jgi:DNA-binding NarL/FixJ family response regulator
MVSDDDAEMARLRAELAALERLAQLAADLTIAGAAWNKVRGNRRSLQGRGSEQHPTMTHLQQKINEAYAAGMEKRAIARTAGVSRNAVRVALTRKKYGE